VGSLKIKKLPCRNESAHLHLKIRSLFTLEVTGWMYVKLQLRVLHDITRANHLREKT
jgi:hypothetical protein